MFTSEKNQKCSCEVVCVLVSQIIGSYFCFGKARLVRVARQWGLTLFGWQSAISKFQWYQVPLGYFIGRSRVIPESTTRSTQLLLVFGRLFSGPEPTVLRANHLDGGRSVIPTSRARPLSGSFAVRSRFEAIGIRLISLRLALSLRTPFLYMGSKSYSRHEEKAFSEYQISENKT